jgi:hypothetical protein
MLTLPVELAPHRIRVQGLWHRKAGQATIDVMRPLFRWLIRLLGLREAVEVYKALIKLLRRLR